MKKGFILSIIAAAQLLLLSNAAISKEYPELKKGEVYFEEIWGYMMRGTEKHFTGSEPVTDIFYFSCSVNYKGRLNTNVKPPVLPSKTGLKRRTHIVITELSNPALMHFVLNPDYEMRDKLINDIVTVSENFDGVQLDFEAIAADDKEAFLLFLAKLKQRLKPEKVFSIAVPARRKYVADAYDYKRISSIVDKVFIMTYDQHWSTSKPGPVSSLSWCKEVALYAGKNIPKNKLVMGLPLYGRSWQDINYNRSVRTGNIKEILSKQNITHEYSDETGDKITYKDTVNITVFCDNNNSLREKLLLFRQYTGSVGFWRLGFENSSIWDEMAIYKQE
jgi:spore germination protein YaaH